jgi:phosphate-selective porin OprO and OprP
MQTVRQFHGRRLARNAAIALVTALAPVAAAAQSTTPDRIDAIERHIRQLEGELQALKRELGATRQQLRQSQRETAQARAQTQQAPGRTGQARARLAVAPPVPSVSSPLAPPETVPEPPPKPTPHVVQTPGNRFGLESADGRNSIFLTGRLHFDVGHYLDYEPASKFAAVQNLNSGVNARRARLGVTGTFAGDWNYTLIYDMGGSSDGFPPTSGAPASGIQNAMLTYNGFNKGPVPLAFEIGYMDTPFTLEEATSTNDILFVERPSIQVVATNIFANDFRSTAGVRSNDERYWAGVYLTGPQSGATHNTGEQIGTFGRATYQLLQSPEYSLHLGADAGALLKPPAPGGIRSITLSDRPEIRVDPTAILSTGSLGTAANPVTGAQVYGVEGAAGWRNFFVQGEYYHIDVDRQGLAANGFDGGYMAGSWIMTGEQRKYLPAAGAYTNPVPDHPFSPWDDLWGYGAFELVARYSTINLNDHFAAGVAPAAGSNAVGGGKQTVYALGLNWYPNTNVRFMFDFLHGDINKKFSTAAGGGVNGTPLGTPVGGQFDALVMRSQFAF